MSKRAYGQFCGVAKGLTIIGERWALLIVRDLLVGPRRYTDLRKGLPAIPTNVLSSRLKELEGDGVIRRRAMAHPDRAVVYELTEYGRELEDVVIHLGRWGSQSLTTPADGEVVTTDSLIMALRTTFRAEEATGVHLGFQVNVGDITIHARVDGADLLVAVGELAGADLVVDTGPQIRAIMAGELSPARAVADGDVRLTGDAALLDVFARIFAIRAKENAGS
ncbi:winged helix-turn-helix transcriptional regulator [Winogradskya consettensis]|uniref:HxlR family transcriptional regulator n=1 Tax=Winogradskya consettensis TaxID=113560 RepID=A0A919T3R1_9ACTN|nr:helix-turn-helix domain-containing protein [Actinoplanes consettensis]GIM85399.1 HxlR family transcriptional regulator [Actinoplanes consettensis]